MAGPRVAVRAELPTSRVAQIVIADKNYHGRGFEGEPAGAGLDLLRPARKGEAPRAGTEFFKPVAAGHRVDQ
jgi:hypothetical protein